ncbi:porin [Polaromonas naphthalenivorans]|uniref:Porin, Gram-negative type n=1 Tax=Polaromonas naphthalenivorans (strain CJ2) TaxID=365044 RepID=A1VJZ0_POLNA|nr:porin [Polaromonas naphthalenivorans]ABM35968.1 porin, Gram-negative type [Polaromonas naphthalenivorans CJ2]
MKKSFIALAVLAASGVASAQSSVTLYGLVDAYVGTSKVKVSVPGASSSLRQSVVDSGGINTSRFGFKGSEDLGGGLKANFVLEGGFKADTGATDPTGGYTNPYTGVVSSSTFSRNSWVGLSGGFGEVKLGKMWTPYDEVKGLGAAAFDANIFAPATNVWLSNNYQANPGNAIYYSTPSFSGFSAAGMYSFGENKAPGVDAGKIMSANVQYANGPIAVALAHQVEKASGAVGSTKFTQLNGSYDLGAAKLLAAVGHVKDGSDKSKEFQVGVDVPLGAVTVSGGVARAKLTGPGGELKSTGFGLAAKYDLSKRTFLYTGLQLSKNEVVGAGDIKTDTFAVGVQHKF